MTTLKTAASANLATPSGAIASDAQEGLNADGLQVMPTLRSLQQTINKVRKVDLGTTADLEPSQMQLVSVYGTSV